MIHYIGLVFKYDNIKTSHVWKLVRGLTSQRLILYIEHRSCLRHANRPGCLPHSTHGHQFIGLGEALECSFRITHSESWKAYFLLVVDLHGAIITITVVGIQIPPTMQEEYSCCLNFQNPARRSDIEPLLDRCIMQSGPTGEIYLNPAVLELDNVGLPFPFKLTMYHLLSWSATLLAISSLVVALPAEQVGPLTKP